MTDPTCPHCGTAMGEHEATRCLDAWVAEMVYRAIVTEKDNVRGFRASFPITFGSQTHYVPRYSSDISAAWEAARHVRDTMEALVSVELRPDSENVVWIYTAKGEYGGIDNNEALAICQ